MIADNTLWDGHVLEQPRSTDTQTIGIKAFNDALVTDDRVEKVILPLRWVNDYKKKVNRSKFMETTRQNKISRLLQKEERDIPVADKGNAGYINIGQRSSY